MRLPFAFRAELGRPRLHTAMYEPEILDGEIYRVGGGRDLRQWIEPASGGRAFGVKLHLLEALQNLGRIRAVPLSAFIDAKATASTLQAA